MRFFKLLNLQHVMAFIFPALIFLVLFGVALAFSHFHSENGKDRPPKIADRFADGIRKGDGPFPLIITLLIMGTLIWGFLYIFIYGVSEVAF